MLVCALRFCVCSVNTFVTYFRPTSSAFMAKDSTESLHHPCLPRRPKLKDKENQTNCNNFSGSFQLLSSSKPSQKYSFSFSMSPDPIEDLCFGFGFISFVYSLHLASNILFAEVNSLSCRIFKFLLIGADVVWR